MNYKGTRSTTSSPQHNILLAVYMCGFILKYTVYYTVFVFSTEEDCMLAGVKQ